LVHEAYVVGVKFVSIALLVLVLLFLFFALSKVSDGMSLLEVLAARGARR
jgi:hypothetical protein